MKLDVRPHRQFLPVLAEGTQKLFAVARLRPDGPAPAPLLPSIAVAVDTSGSMYEKLPGGRSKIDVAIDLLSELPSIPGVQDGTEIAVLQFDTDASVLLPLSVLGPDAKDVTASHARRLRAFNGGTRMGRALELGLAELRRGTAGRVRRLIVITDGETTDPERCIELASEAGAEGTGILCIGLGSEYNEDLLVEIAERSRSRVAHVDESEASLAELRETLQREITRARRETLAMCRLRVEAAQGVVLVGFRQVFPSLGEIPRLTPRTWLAGNLAGDDETVFLADLEVGPLSPGPHEVLRITLEGAGGTEGPTRLRHEASLSITVTADAALPRQVDEDVLFYVRQRNLAGFVDAAAAATRSGDGETARRSIAEARRLSQVVGNAALERSLGAAGAELDRSGTLQPATRKSLRVGARMRTRSGVARATELNTGLRTLPVPSPPPRPNEDDAADEGGARRG